VDRLKRRLIEAIDSLALDDDVVVSVASAEKGETPLEARVSPPNAEGRY
jgi:hypothetical protein